MINEKSKEDFMDFMVNEIQKDRNMVLKEVRLDHILAECQENPCNPGKKPAPVYFDLMNSSEEPTDIYPRQIIRNIIEGKYTVPIFHKDEFLIRPKENRKSLIESIGLKGYTHEWTRKLVELKPQIGYTLRMQSPLNKIIVYQPKTDKLDECLRAYDFQIANPIPESVIDSELAGKYRIANEIYTVPRDQLHLRIAQKSVNLLTLGTVPKGPKIKEEDYF